MSKKYCLRTPITKMGFSQRSSCKAQGFIKRSDGTRRKSKKYIQKKTNKSRNKQT